MTFDNPFLPSSKLCHHVYCYTSRISPVFFFNLPPSECRCSLQGNFIVRNFWFRTVFSGEIPHYQLYWLALHLMKHYRRKPSNSQLHSRSDLQLKLQPGCRTQTKTRLYFRRMMVLVQVLSNFSCVVLASVNLGLNNVNVEQEPLVCTQP